MSGKQIILINPYKNPLPMKILQEAERLREVDGLEVEPDKYIIKEIQDMPPDSVNPNNIKSTIIVWFFAFTDQLESKLIKLRKFVKKFDDSYTPIAIIAPDVIMGLSKRIKFIRINQAAHTFRKMADSYFGALELATDIKFDVYNPTPHGKTKEPKKVPKEEVRLNRSFREKEKKELKTERRDERRESDINFDELTEINRNSPENKLTNWYKTGNDAEMDASAKKITAPEDKKAILNELCNLTPVLNYWTKSEDQIDKAVLDCDSNKFQITMSPALEKLIENGEKVIFFRGNHADGGIYFYIEEPGKNINNKNVNFDIPGTIWKIERRKSKRLQFLPMEKFKVTINMFLRGKPKTFIREALGISDGGIMVALAAKDMQNFTPGTEVKNVSFTLSGRTISCPGKVIWCRDTSFKTISSRKRIKSGINFIDLAEIDKEHIRKWVEEKFEATGAQPI